MLDLVAYIFLALTIAHTCAVQVLLVGFSFFGVFFLVVFAAVAALCYTESHQFIAEDFISPTNSPSAGSAWRSPTGISSGRP